MISLVKFLLLWCAFLQQRIVVRTGTVSGLQRKRVIIPLVPSERPAHFVTTPPGGDRAAALPSSGVERREGEGARVPRISEGRGGGRGILPGGGRGAGGRTGMGRGPGGRIGGDHRGGRMGGAAGSTWSNRGGAGLAQRPLADGARVGGGRGGRGTIRGDAVAFVPTSGVAPAAYSGAGGALSAGPPSAGLYFVPAAGGGAGALRTPATMMPPAVQYGGAGGGAQVVSLRQLIIQQIEYYFRWAWAHCRERVLKCCRHLVCMFSKGRASESLCRCVGGCSLGLMLALQGTKLHISTTCFTLRMVSVDASLSV